MFYSKSTGGFYSRAIHSDGIPQDAVEITAELHAALIAGQATGKRIFSGENGQPVLVDPEPPTFQEQVKANVAAIQAELDRQAALKGYDNIVSACSYAAQAEGMPFKEEGKAFLNWRSQVWSQAYAVLAEAQDGQRALPTPEESVAAMPALVLPA